MTFVKTVTYDGRLSGEVLDNFTPSRGLRVTSFGLLGHLQGSAPLKPKRTLLFLGWLIFTEKPSFCLYGETRRDMLLGHFPGFFPLRRNGTEVCPRSCSNLHYNAIPEGYRLGNGKKNCVLKSFRARGGRGDGLGELGFH
jgi:hypothetical protein